MDNIVFLGLGSNLGNKKQNINKAVSKLSENPDITVCKVSSFLKNSALGPGLQPDYLNIAVKIQTVLKPDVLLCFVKNIEKKMGRKKSKRWSPRIIDIDILFFNDSVINTNDLVIPHPEICKREFVLKPLAEIQPDFMHPVIRKNILEILNSLSNHENHKRYISDAR